MDKKHISRFCQLCREFKINIIQLKCDHIICYECSRTQHPQGNLFPFETEKKSNILFFHFQKIYLLILLVHGRESNSTGEKFCKELIKNQT
jgi:hypothetical protein